eukprot:NODE_902_length_3237_cov_0.930848.p1 type:complete len:716 gc:universal NODE_902_length_3237_cov_0.930848:3036-889(-)
MATNPFTNEQYSSRYNDLLKTRKSLPVYMYKKEYLDMLSNKVLLVIGETGSGKTTQLPQFTAEHLKSIGDDRLVACTQPRRVAAMSVSERVAEEMDVKLGEECGYKIRFEDVTSNKTKLVYLTDGMLLREAMIDPLLLRYKVIMLDESHERTLATDILMGVIKQLLRKRKDIIIVVMSATLDSSKFSEFFDGAPLLKIPGRTYPVDIYYTDAPQRDYVTATVETVQLIHQYEPSGDILLFLTGEDEIEDACSRIKQACRNLNCSSGINKLQVLPLYSQLHPGEQRKIFQKTPLDVRKCVVATNIAETSITVDGVVYVIDPGFVKQKAFNPRTRMQSLQVTPISQASANQRAGRAGRTRPGKCFRLYTSDAYNDLQPQTYPEMMRSNLTNVVLQLAKIGIYDVVHFDYLDPPSPETLIRALEMLHYLEAINEEGQLTDMGHIMADLPLDPEYARILIKSQDYNCTAPILSIVAMLSVPNCFLRPIDKREEADNCHSYFAHPDGDHLTLLQVFEEFLEAGDQKQFCWDNYLNFRNLTSANKIRNQLEHYLPKLNISNNCMNKSDHLYYDSIKTCLLQGFFSFVAYYDKTSKCYRTCKDEMPVAIHPSSVLKTKDQLFCIMYNEFVQTTKDYVRTCTRIDPEWLLQVNLKYYDMETFPDCELKNRLKFKYKQLIEHQQPLKKKKRIKTPEEIEEKKRKRAAKKEMNLLKKTKKEIEIE